MTVTYSTIADPTSLLEGYLGGNFSENSCGRHCYQNYQYASHDFYYNCRSELNPDKIKLGAGLSLYQEFRNQACGMFTPTHPSAHSYIVYTLIDEY